MIRIENSTYKITENFWNHCLFHPTDAIEDPWGRRILDRIAADGSIGSVRIYAMLEDIVYTDMDGSIKYDFRINDLRLDYLVEKGFDLLIAYAAMPDCIALRCDTVTSVSKNKTRYKGKMFNTSIPKDYALWEEVCYEYTKHIVERYGIERVSKWRMQCFNEPDIPQFFMSHLPVSDSETRVKEYNKLYASFEKGVRRVSDDIKIGGPALAYQLDFFKEWLKYVKENKLKLDFISVHNYGSAPAKMQSGEKPANVMNNIEKHRKYVDAVKAQGFADVPLIIDEWGMASHGFFNRDEYPVFMCRENEVFSAYFAKLIGAFIYSEYIVDKMMICLSGQHEMTEDFSGFRNFFTLNFIAKPIYNAYVLASKLGKTVLNSCVDDENICVIPTKHGDGKQSILLSYASQNFEEDIPEKQEKLEFAEDIIGKNVTVWCIDKNTTNPYRLFEKEGMSADVTEEQINRLRDEGTLKPIAKAVADSNGLTLTLTANSTFLITVE